MRITDLIILGIVAVAVVAVIIIAPKTAAPSNEVKKFSSQSEINDFVKSNSESYSYYGGMMETMQQSAADTAAPVPAQAQEFGGAAKSIDYSRTNVQVEGVDEADIVKNDGKYLYIVSGQSIVIVDAYPAESSKIVAEIDLKRTPHEIFVNSNKLVVFGYEYPQYEPQPFSAEKLASPTVIYPYYYSRTFINVYDISDRANPVLKRNLSLDGDYFDSRMIGDYAYAVVNQPFSLRDGVVPLPKVYSPEGEVAVAPTDIYYFDIPDSSYRFVTVLALNTQDDEQDINKQVYMMGYSENIYVSQNNIYITYMKRLPPSYYTERMAEKAIIPLMPPNVANEMRAALQKDVPSYQRMQEVQDVLVKYFNTLSESAKEQLQKELEQRYLDYYQELAKETQKTVVHKIAISNGNIEYKANGEAPGQLLNQFSMDEHNGYLRMATTTGDVWSETSLNHMYVLDENMNIVGKLEDLAKGERIYSARFIGDRAYMVTFKKIDPLFVIDLSDPANPKVLGKLKIPGYSDYLHPYDENHIIGIGKEAVEPTAEETGGRPSNFAWYQGMKIALFDVSDPNDPKEISKFNIGDRGTDSEALHDHKAFLFSKDKNLLVIPIKLYEIDRSKGEPQSGSTYGEYKLSGAYVFELTLDKGFVLKGIVKHHEKTTEDPYYYYDSPVRRSMYIDNVLYTLSNTLKMNSLDDLSEVNKIELQKSNEVIGIEESTAGI